MKNNFKIIANVLRMLPKDEPVSWGKLATIFEELSELKEKNNIVKYCTCAQSTCSLMNDTYICHTCNKPMSQQ